MSRFARRAMDRAWFTFFVFHIPISLAVDFQALYPTHWTASTPLPAFLKWYTGWSKDPIILGAFSNQPEWDWLRTFFWLEAVFQLPVWIIGALGLWNNDKRVYRGPVFILSMRVSAHKDSALLLAYGASTATTLIPTLNALWATKTVPPLTTLEMTNLLACYVPYLLIPLAIAVDMGLRLTKIIGAAQARKQV